jgi:5-methyltetrahydrofolate--homocysteine methyltransferase
MLVVDGLCMAVGADAEAPKTGLETLRRIKKLGCGTMLGLSNVSHGMPARRVINRTWLAMAMAAGLDLAIANPMDRGIAETVAAGDLLCGHDRDAKKFLSAAASFAAAPPLRIEPSRSAPSAAGRERESREHTGKQEEEAVSGDDAGGEFGDGGGAWPALRRAIVQGDSGKAGELGRALDEAGTEPASVINEGVVPALAEVGQLYESGRYFLPQLLSAAAAAQRVCETELARIAEMGENVEKGTVVLATVEGDLHDLGKNIVGTMLRSHGYKVVDLGKNVACAEIERAAREQNAQVIGLSALMTSTMSRMEENIPILRKALPGIRVIVGGASVSEDYSDRIGADGYSPDAIGAVKLVARMLTGK